MASKSKKPSSKPPLPPRQNMSNNGGPQNNGPTCMNPDIASMNGYIGQQGQIVPSQIPVQQIPSPQHVPPAPIQGYSAAALEIFKTTVYKAKVRCISITQLDTDNTIWPHT